MLTLARVVQGLGAAGIMSVNIALIRFVYPHARLGQGVGNLAVVVAVCSAGSPSVAAAILLGRLLALAVSGCINAPIGIIGARDGGADAAGDAANRPAGSIFRASFSTCLLSGSSSPA